MRAIPFVASSQIREIVYNDETGDLSVTFQSTGATYTYKGVPAAVADGFASASSAGKYLNAAIKNVYSFELA